MIGILNRLLSKKRIRISMELSAGTLNDVGLTLEIIGFLIFLFIPIRKVIQKETYNILLESAPDTPPEPTKMEKLEKKWTNQS